MSKSVYTHNRERRCRLFYILLIWKLVLTRRKRNRTSRCASRAADFSSSWMNKSPCISRRSINHHCQQRPAEQRWKQVETRTIASYHFFYQITKVNITFMHQSHNTELERDNKNIWRSPFSLYFPTESWKDRGHFFIL